MNTKLYKLPFLIAIVSLVCFLSACSKKNNPAPATPMGVVYFHIHTDIDTNEVDSGVVAKDASGRHFQLNLAKFYLSGIVLYKADGSTYTLNNVYILKDMENEVYYADSVPTGNYTSVSFNVGLDAAANAKAPSGYVPSNVLSSTSMWFGSTSEGYIFMNVQGLADTTVAQTGPVNSPFNYLIGTSAMLKNVKMPAMDAAMSVVTNQVAYVHIVADYGKLLSGIDFKTQSNASPYVNAATAMQIDNNIPNMFRYEY